MNINAIIFSVSIFYASFSYARGATSSAGGNTISNATNPWFLENTSNVTYCLEVDENHMGVDHATSLRIIQSSLAYWKKEFASAKNRTYPSEQLAPYNQIRIATQNFIYETCNDLTDLKFQFGMLSTFQRRLMDTTGEVVGLAMRTSYDVAKLKGSGFIYIAPQSGPLRPKSRAFAKTPWNICDGCVLEEVLKHELGHVFGLNHDDNKKNDIMGEFFPAKISSESFQQEILNRPNGTKWFLYNIRTPYFKFQQNPLFIGSTLDYEPQNIKKLLALKENETIIRLQTVPSNSHISSSEYVFEVYNEIDQTWSKIGELCNSKLSIGSKSKVSIYIDDDQKVFSVLPSQNFYGSLVSSNRDFSLNITGSFCSNRGMQGFPIMLLQELDGKRYLSTVVNDIINLKWFQDDWKLRINH